MNTDSAEGRFYRYIGIQVQFFRQKDFFTQADLADKVGIVRTSIVNLENGRQRVPIYTLQLIAQALSVPLAELLPADEAAIEKVLGEAPAKWNRVDKLDLILHRLVDIDGRLSKLEGGDHEH